MTLLSRAGLLITVVLVSACVGKPNPAQVALPSPSNTTAILHPSILDVFPLGMGATWVFRVTLDYAEGHDVIHWTGNVTETITRAVQQDDAWLFDMQVTGHPLFNSENRRVEWIALDDRLYQWHGPFDASTIFVQNGHIIKGEERVSWPLQVGQQWGDPQFLARGDGMYVWRVDDMRNITTPAQTFQPCYELVFLTNPDDTRYWFCPKVGLVRYEYHHHGSVLDEVWELIQSIPGASLRN